ncbi:MAG: helix-turn-helix transcriptional regulator [Acholeplasmataceae bacterium]|jgi:LuxR family maltose regulon positive regulatory protein|nr:helix-turn-helix transcriptional regulator [Acholeplasmataceae bacterium]
MDPFLHSLDNVIKAEDITKIEEMMMNNTVRFFDSPYIAEYYKRLKNVPVQEPSNQVVLAWLAFLSGDFMAHYNLVMHVDFNQLNDVMKGLYLDLKALSKIFGTLDERIKLSLEALHYVSQDKGFYKAYAFSVHANLIFLKDQIRDAASYFEQSFELFFKEKIYFQASVALSNALFNYICLAQFDHVIEKAEHTLMLTSSFQSIEKMYWEVICMPLGAAHVMMNKPSLALDCLDRAYRAIDHMGLVHMHGNLEIYYMKAYILLNDQDSLKAFVNKTITLFEHTHMEVMQMVITYGKIMSNHPTKQAEIERLENIVLSEKKMRPLTLESILHLCLTEGCHIDFFEPLISYIESYRYAGDLMSLQTALLHLGEYYYVKNDVQKAKVILEEAIEMYHKKQLRAPFFLYPYQCESLIRKLDPTIYKRAPKLDDIDALTNRELDILDLINQGKSNGEISNILFISEGTVKWHINHILAKLGVKNRVEALNKAKSLKLIK